MSTTIPDLVEAPAHGGEVDWTDLFCGAGGSSLGLHHVPGFKVKYALNHWDLAVQAHNANFPDTDHEVTEIQDVHPSRFGRTRCAWFSPSCTAQAYCGPRGTDDASVRSRATMWDVPRWAAYHKYDVCVIENVVETKLWCDNHVVVRNGKEYGCSCGSSYESWYAEMEKLGYRGHEIYFNSQHALVPQSRDRLYIVFVREGIPMPDFNFQPPGYCSACEDVAAGNQAWKIPAKGSARDNPRLHFWGRYGKQYLYTCVRCEEVLAPAVLGTWAIIDDTIPITTIGSRPRPIAQATRRRIRVGVERIGQQVPVQLQVGGNLYERPGYARVWSLDDPLRTITATPYMAMALPAGGQKAHAKSFDDPLHTIMTKDRLAVVIPNRMNAIGDSTGEPMRTVTTAPAQHMLVTLRKGMDGSLTDVPGPAQATRADQGFLVYNGNPGFVRVLHDAAGTITARDKSSLLVPYNRTAVPHGDREPLTTVTTRDRTALLNITDADIDGWYFRMLKWKELQRGQAMHVLPDGSPYLLNARVRKKNGKYRDLNDTERVKMIGNAVSSPVAAMIGYPIADALAAAA